MTTTLRFGVLSHALHRPDHDPAIQLAADVRLAEHADRLGLDELWWTERRSGGWQIVADPMLMAAHAAASTRRIRLGAVVNPVRHHPANLVDGAAQLDHLTRGRFVLGLGADVMVEDAATAGLSATDAEHAIEETVGAVATLLRGKGRVSLTPRHAPWVVRDHTPHLLPRGRLDTRAVSFGGSAAPELAGTLGLGLVSTAAAQAVGLQRENRMAQTWLRAEAAAHQAGRVLSRDRWSVTTPIHLADTEIEARRQVRHGIARWAEYARASMPVEVPAGTDADTLIDSLHAAGRGVVGTPAMAIEHLERVLDLSAGVGTVLLEVADWASPAETHASLERFAREVVPHVTGISRSRLAASAGGVGGVGTSGRVGRRAATPLPVHGPAPTPVRGVSRIHLDEGARSRGRHAVDPSPD
ncbi:LLM class flavin-dependent oxidoreductase [Pseudactinotalea suaedae]|uniref:LLM class flavin-dependent oxidoreductase n=1 Tax=Pseudactinotalea suaedae TaxID=1524924 RepID=UPI0012E117BD|nr:LLM class flavin-dependent oxidoreductase [Pseudactinotalea suaedae]